MMFLIPKMLILDCTSFSLTTIGRYLILFHMLRYEGNAQTLPQIAGANLPQIATTNLPQIEDYYDNYRKLGDSCLSDKDCESIRNGVCDLLSRKCECSQSHPVGDNLNNCREVVALKMACVSDGQCEFATKNSHCFKFLCHCQSGFSVKTTGNGTIYCHQDLRRPEPENEIIVDYTMLGILVGMAAMFIVMCVVLRMFSKARFQDQRTIFNSPRLLKISLARKTREDSERRGSRCSVASRQPSIYSGLNIPTKSPTGSQGSDRRSTAGSRRPSIQTPLDDRKSHQSRNVDQVTVDIRGSRENPGPKVNKV